MTVLYSGTTEASEASVQKSSKLAAQEERAASRAFAEDGLKLEEAQSVYLDKISVDHDNWFKKESELAEVTQSTRKYELEQIERHLADYGRLFLEESLEERCEQHLNLLTPGSKSDKFDGVSQDGQAGQEWTKEVCKAVIMEMRKDWRTGQKKVLQQLAAELRAERVAAADALERQMSMTKKVSEAVKGMWSGEIEQAQQDLDRIADAYKRALKVVFEAKLREARQHSKEQAEYFQKEIREALLFEQKEYAAHHAQRRRMRLAMLKWRFDYTADAKRMAGEVVGRAVLAKLAAAGLSETEWFQKIQEEKMEAKREAKRQAKADAGNAEEDPDEDEDSDSDSDISASAVADSWRPEPDLVDCRLILEKMWSRLSTSDDEPRDFLYKLEETVPFEEEILIMYEEELARHGVLSALDATDGRAEDALQAEREAAAQVDYAQTQVQMRDQGKRSKKSTVSVKPAVPTVKRRIATML